MTVVPACGCTANEAEEPERATLRDKRERNMALTISSSGQGSLGLEEVLKEQPFRLRADDVSVGPGPHILRKGVRCETESRGFATPHGRSAAEIVLDASEGFIPLWAKGVTLRWRFREASLSGFADPEAAKGAVETLLAEAIIAWGDAAPVKFAQRDDVWDFEIVVKNSDDCDINGCVLASAFFPDGGRHELVIYPKMFEQSTREQVETLAHEIGHVFGLRHFFALVSEQRWPAEVFGTHDKFSIMNYGDPSHLTDADRSDLRSLYELAWAGKVTEINGTEIRLVQPYHALQASGGAAIAVAVADG